MISESINDLFHTTPIGVMETQSLENAEFCHTKNWIVLIPEGSATMPFYIPLFGARIRAKKLANKNKNSPVWKVLRLA